jgi:hypothetical protein
LFIIVSLASSLSRENQAIDIIAVYSLALAQMTKRGGKVRPIFAPGAESVSTLQA